MRTLERRAILQFADAQESQDPLRETLPQGLSQKLLSDIREHSYVGIPMIDKRLALRCLGSAQTFSTF